jgi:hypothetical protein
MINKMPSKDSAGVVVRSGLLSAVWAHCVFFVGESKDLDETATPVIRSRVGDTWSVTPDLERGKEHPLRCLVYGHEWHKAWRADKYVPNLFVCT